MVLKILVSFGIGVYVGVYACQHYKVPHVDEPKELWRKLKELLDKHKKPPEG